MPITALYLSLLVPLLLFLSARVIGQRRAEKVEIGDGGDRELLRRMRVHANFVEYVPIAVLALALVESLAAPAILLHAAGILLVGGRYLHAYALSQNPHILNLRVLGMVLTFTTIGALAALCLGLSVVRLFG